MTSGKLRVFVSSRMEELADERTAVKDALDGLGFVEAWVFEEDAGARSETVRETSLGEVERADLYIGIFWKGFGEGTAKEFRHAYNRHVPCLIYEKVAEERDPRLQGFLDREISWDKGPTVKRFSTLAELRECVTNDVQAHVVRMSQQRLPKPQPIRERRELKILEGIWERVHALVQSAADAGTLDVNKEWVPLSGGRGSHVEGPDETARSLAPDSRIADLFHGGSRFLLILGAPGSGKTTTLHELAKECLFRAEKNLAEPTPIVLSLPSFRRGENLKRWLEREMTERYRVPRKLASRWIREGRLLYLLDALDEVAEDARAECVKAINSFLSETGARGLVTCCREREYDTLPTRLALDAAIRLLPLTASQIDEHLRRGGEDFEALRRQLEQDSTLLQVASVPLMLGMMRVAFSGEHAVKELPGAGEKERTKSGRAEASVEGIRARVFETYVAQMFRRRPHFEQPFAKQDVIGWLGWLAVQVRNSRRTVFSEDLVHLHRAWWADLFVVFLSVCMASALVLAPALAAGQAGSLGGVSKAALAWSVAVPGVLFVLEALAFLVRWAYRGGSFLLGPNPMAVLCAVAGLAGGIAARTYFGAWIWLPVGLGIAVVIAVTVDPEELAIALFLQLVMICGIALVVWSGSDLPITKVPGWMLTNVEWILVSTWFAAATIAAREISSEDSVPWLLTTPLVAAGALAVLRWSSGFQMAQVFPWFIQVYDRFVPAIQSTASVVGATWTSFAGALLGPPAPGKIFALVGLAGILGPCIPPEGRLHIGVRERARAIHCGALLGLFAAIWMNWIYVNLQSWLPFLPLGVLWFVAGAVVMYVGLLGQLAVGGFLDLISHILHRAVLHWRGCVPWRSSLFLDYATRLVFLRRVPGGYAFFHQLLLEHFAHSARTGGSGFRAPG